MGFGQAFRHLLADRDRFSGGQRPLFLDRSFEVLAGHILHRDEQPLAVLVQLVHPADVLMGDLAGQLDLVPEALDDALLSNKTVGIRINLREDKPAKRIDTGGGHAKISS
jgi:hypothetical protein